MLRQLNERMQKWGFSWEGLRDNRHGEWWVLAQMSLIAAHWLPPTPPPSDLGIDWPLLGPTAAAAIPSTSRCCWHWRPCSASRHDGRNGVCVHGKAAMPIT
jgi:hypothetical protein